MTAFLRWYAAVVVLGALMLPVAFVALRRLPDRGYFAARTLGVLVHGLVLWLGTALGLLRNDAGGALIAALGCAGLALLFAREAFRPGPGQDSLPRWLRANAGLVVLGELLFVAAFAGWAFVRAHDPAASHTERPMDLMFLTGIHVSPDFPPRDPWLAGYPIAYYYLGHWMLNALSLLAGQPPAVAFNLGQACWLSLLVCGCFGLGFDLAALDRRATRGSALAAGLLTATTVALAGNPQGVLDAAQRAGLELSSLARGRAAYNLSAPGEPWWWWRASRVLEDKGPAGEHIEVIDEFPAFSFIVGDAHPHLLALPFGVLGLAIALGLHLEPRRPRGQAAEVRAPALSLLAVGALPALNAWDFPTQWLLSVLAFTLPPVRGSATALRPRLLGAAGWGALVLLASLLVSLPYLLTAQSQVAGIAVNREHRTPLFQLLLMLGPLLAGVLLLLVRAARETRTSPRRGLTGAALGAGAVLAWSATVGLRPGGEWPFTMLVLGSLLGASAAVLAAEEWPTPGLRFTVLLGTVGLLLLLGPELLYVRDGFGTRMNTVFKLYYAAWLLLGVATAHALASAWRTGPLLRATRLAALGLVLSGLGYTAAAVSSVAQGFSGTRTLDALAYVGELDADEDAAFRWVRAHTAPRSVVLQALGHSYRPEESRLSVATGRATLLGWEGHEVQWRGKAYAAMAAGRAEATETVYRLAGAEGLSFALQRWRIDYVFVGKVERRAYGVDPAREELFDRVMERVFAQGDVRIYRRRDS